MRTQLRAYSSATPVDVPVPSMNGLFLEIKVVEWLKNPGDAVAANDVVAVIETNRLEMEIRTPFTGTLVKHHADVKENAWVGFPLFQIACELETVVVPSMGDSIATGTVVSWLKSAGDSVATDDIVVIVQTDAGSIDVRAPKSGIVQEVLATVDEIVSVGAPLFKIAPCLVDTPAPAAANKVEWPLNWVAGAGSLYGRLLGKIYRRRFLRSLEPTVDSDIANELLKDSLTVIEKSEKVTFHLGAPLVGHGEVARWHHQGDHATIGEEAPVPSRICMTYTVAGPNGEARVLVDVTEGASTDEYNRLLVVFEDRKEVVAIFGH